MVVWFVICLSDRTYIQNFGVVALFVCRMVFAVCLFLVSDLWVCVRVGMYVGDVCVRFVCLKCILILFFPEPYDELLYSPGYFELPGGGAGNGNGAKVIHKEGKRITNIYVSSMHSVIAGRRNWGIASLPLPSSLFLSA